MIPIIGLILYTFINFTEIPQQYNEDIRLERIEVLEGQRAYGR